MTEIVDGLFGGLTDERKAEAVRILAVNHCGEPVGYKTLLEHPEAPCTRGCMAPGSSPHRHGVLVGYRLIGTTGYVETDADLEPRTVGTLHSLTGVTGHGKPHQLNRMILDVDSEVTGFGTHNRLVIFGSLDNKTVEVREDVFADPTLPLSTEWQRQSIAHHPHHRLHPAGTDLVHVSSTQYSGHGGQCIEHVYRVVKQRPFRILIDPAKEA